VRRKRSDAPGTVDHERQALFEQRLALEELRAELAERVAAVQSREEELRAAIADVRAGREPGVTLPAVVPVDHAARARALDERERILAAREAELARAHAGNGSGPGETDAADDRAAAIDERERALDDRGAALDERERALEHRAEHLDQREREMLANVDPDAARLAGIESRLVELKAAEQAFLRTREELSSRAEAVTAREHLVAQREREVQDQAAGWGSADMSELEARLRRLETRSATPAQGFSGGFRKLEEGGRRGGRP
jgi:hypothetical protein